MSAIGPTLPTSPEFEKPDISHIITEDEMPVDDLPSEKEMRLLVEPLYSSWDNKVPFLAASNVGIFSALNRPPVVPDMFLSLDVETHPDWWAKKHRSYFLWEFGKAPEIVVEIVSNKDGGETVRKMREYARMRIPYYAIYDPQLLIQEEPLCAYGLQINQYVALPRAEFPQLGLSLVEWDGTFEGRVLRWLRWADLNGNIILTGAERALQEKQRGDIEKRRADAAQLRVAELEAKLRALGEKP